MANGWIHWFHALLIPRWKDSPEGATYSLKSKSRIQRGAFRWKRKVVIYSIVSERNTKKKPAATPSMFIEAPREYHQVLRLASSSVRRVPAPIAMTNRSFVSLKNTFTTTSKSLFSCSFFLLVLEYFQQEAIGTKLVSSSIMLQFILVLLPACQHMVLTNNSTILLPTPVIVVLVVVAVRYSPLTTNTSKKFEGMKKYHI